MINTVPAPAALTAPWGSSSHLQTHLNTHTIPHLVKHGLPPSTRPSCFIHHLQILEHKPRTSHALLLECTNTNPQLCLPWCYMRVLNAKCVLMAQGLSSKDYDSLLCAAEDELHKLLRERSSSSPVLLGGGCAAGADSSGPCQRQSCQLKTKAPCSLGLLWPD